MYMVNSAKRNIFPNISFFLAGVAGHGVLNKDPTVCLVGARPNKRYIFKYIKIKIAEYYINNICFGNKTIQQRKVPNNFVLELYSYVYRYLPP